MDKTELYCEECKRFILKYFYNPECKTCTKRKLDSISKGSG